MLGLEGPPFALNDQCFTAYREKCFSRYKDARKVVASDRAAPAARAPQ